MQIVAPVVEKLRATKCGGQVAYVAKDTTELKIPVNGTIDGLLDKVFSFYSLSYQALSPGFYLIPTSAILAMSSLVLRAVSRRPLIVTPLLLTAHAGCG